MSRPTRPEDDDPAAKAEHALPVDLQQLERRAATALVAQQAEREQRIARINQELAEISKASVRRITAFALRSGISTSLHSGEPNQTAVSEGAMLIAQALHREGVPAHELRSLLQLWKRPIDSPELFVAAEQLLGPQFCRLPYDGGTPLSDLCEILLGSAHEAGDLIAAGAIVGSIYRKLALIENESEPVANADPVVDPEEVIAVAPVVAATADVRPTATPKRKKRVAKKRSKRKGT